MKSINGFYKDKNSKDGLRSNCKECWKESNKKYRENNPRYYKGYYKDNIENFKDRNRKWYKNNIEKAKETSRKYRKIYPDKLKEWKKRYFQRKIRDPKFRLNNKIKIAIWESIKRNKNSHRWEYWVGYKLEDLIIHLENQFKPGMSWDNYGKEGWDIDHIKPISSFNFTSYNDTEFKECWALDNLQPLWAAENISKGAKL